MYTPLPRADIKPYHESYFNDAKSPVRVESEPRNGFVAEGLAATLQSRALGAPIKEEVDMYDRKSNFTQPTVYMESSNNVKTESSENVFKRESPIIQGPIRTGVKRFIEGQRTNFANEISSETHSNSSTQLVEEVSEQQRPRKCNDEGKNVLNIILSYACFIFSHY